MSPEQAKGRDVDHRADIWAFGCVLFEMLAGARAFAGDDVTDTLAAVLLKEPDWSCLPDSTPRMVRRLIEQCLRKDSRQRLQHIGDARLDLEEGASADVGASPPSQQRFSSQMVDCARGSRNRAGRGCWTSDMASGPCRHGKKSSPLFDYSTSGRRSWQ